MTPIPIAVIGMGCRLPGGANSPENLWEMLAEGRSGWCEIPADRWNRDSFYHPNQEAKEAINTRGGYFLQEDITTFDATFFNISSFEAHVMDPQQRILLETTYEALENAGLSLDRIRGSDTSVHVGVYARDYDRMGYKDLPEITKLQLTGTGEAIISNRISYLLDLKGASVTIDTGCSGSMVALHQACQGLRIGETTMAIVGGTQLLLHPDQMVAMSMVGMTNPDGRCYVFDSRGSGYARGEGVGALVLKRLDDAVRDGDPVHAIIRNTGLNQDGKTSGISLPNSDAQTALMRSVYLSAGLDPQDTSYVEAHGTGTQAGDHAEISSIASVFCEGAKRENDLIVGSIKSNIGHLEASSGVAGLIKGILILKKGLIPPNLDFETPKKALRLEERRIKVPQQLTPLPGSGTRRVSVNSFGYGGTNAHIILESAPLGEKTVGNVVGDVKDEKPSLNGSNGAHVSNGVGFENGTNGVYEANDVHRAHRANGKHEFNSVNGQDGKAVNGNSINIVDTIKLRNSLIAKAGHESPQLFVLTASTKNSLLANMDKLHEWISFRQSNEVDMRDLSYTLSSRRTMMKWRTSFVAQTRDELVTSLSQKRITKISPSVRIVFLFTGQGAQWFGMGRELITVDSAFRKSILKSDKILKGLGCEWSLLEELLRDDSTTRVSQSDISQPATTAIQIALVDLLGELAIRPQAVLGHSSGEISAAYAAGALTHEMAIDVSYRRGFISSFCKRTISVRGAMLAVGVGEVEVLQYIKMTRTGIAAVACVNSPDSTTISGDETAIDELKIILDGLSIFNRKLKVDTAYHSHHMKAVANDYLDLLQGITSSLPRDGVKFYSSVSANKKISDFGPSYWVENLVSKVSFSDGLQMLSRTELANSQHSSALPANLFIEIGPHSALSGPIRQTMLKLDGQELKYSYLPSLVRNQSAIRTVLELAGKVFDCGYPVDLKASASIDGSKEQQRTISDLAPYSWDHSTSFWHESRLSRDHRLRSFPYHDLLGLLVVGSSINEPIWRNHISLETLPWLRDHVVDGFTIFPGSGYLCMAVEAVRQIAHVRQIPGVISRFIMKDIMFSKAIIVPEQRPDGLTPEVEVQLTMKPVKNVTDRTAGEFFRISSIQNNVWSEHCSGTIMVEFISKVDEVEGMREEDSATAAHVQNLQRLRDSCSTELAPGELYDDFKANGNVFGPNFAIISEANITNCEAIAKVIIPDVAACMPAGFMQPHIMHPTTLDAVNQMAIPLYKRHCSSGPVMPVMMEEITIAADIINKPGSELFVITKITPESSRSTLMDTVVFQASENSAMTPVLTVVRGQLRGIGEAQTSDEDTPFHRKMSYRMKWAADVQYIKPESLTAAVSNMEDGALSQKPAAVSRKMSPVDELALYERAAGLYMRFALQKIAQDNATPDISKSHLLKLFNWMTVYSGSAANQELIQGMTSADIDNCLLAAKEAGVEGEMITRIGEHLPSIFTGVLDPLALMLEDGLLHRFYSQGLLVANYLQLIDYLKLLVFKNRHMTILEVGAGTGGTTLPLLQSLSAPDGLLLSRYDYTDISAGFFEGAKTLLQQWSGSLNFKTLDISRDPVEQGFIAGSYDLVIASNVLHATSSMDVTISNVRKLLKPGGRLVLVELTRLTAAMNIVFGTLSGWWAAEDGRVNCPLLSLEQWNSALTLNGLNGVEFSTPDHEGPTARSRFMVSKAIGESQDIFKNAVTMELLCESAVLHDFAENLSLHFDSKGLKSSVSSWSAHPLSKSSIYIVLDDTDHPLLVDPSPELYEQIKHLLITAKSVLWISARGESSPTGNLTGNEGLVTGVARVIRRENEGMRFITIDIQQSLKDFQNYDHLFHTVSDVMSATFYSSSVEPKTYETEYAYSNGGLHIPRVVTDVAFNKWVTKAVSAPEVELGLYHQPQRPLKLHVESPGLLSSMRFIDDTVGALQIPLAADELQIETRAYGVNFKDVFIAMGQMLPSFKMTGECSGIVTAVGADFQSRFKVGDRVCSIGAEPFSSLARVKGHFAYQLPTSMSFAVGASVPVVFLTAYHCLVEIARLRRGQTVLIHAASGGVGQAALMLAQHVGAEIFATVGSTAKRQLLIDKFNLPESHIFSTRSRTFKKGVLRLTENKGVDVVLNSLSGEMLNDSWACIAPLGTFLEIGKADIMRRGQLSMAPFDRHVIFAAVDLTVLLALRPEEMPDRFSKIMSMFESGFLRPVEPITTMDMTNIEDAFRLIQSRKHTGKVVLEVNRETIVKVISARPPPLQLNEQGTYIVAGGLGDLGRRICRLLAANGAKHIATLSRRSLDPDLQKSFEDDLSTYGAKLHIIACDITDGAMLKEVAFQIQSSLPVVKGIIHAGMVLRDHPMEQMNLQDYNAALAPKVHGTRNLHNNFGVSSLEFFIMLSSITCILGKTGQANYSAGNAFQDAFAHAQSQVNPHTRYISLNLGAIDGSEAITSLPIRQQELMRQGAILMQFDELFKLLEYSMSSQAQQDGLVQSAHGFDLQSMEAVFDSFALNNPLFNQLPVTVKDEDVEGPKTESVNIEKAIRNASTYAEAEVLIIKAIAERFALFSAIPVDEINLEVPLQEFGLDSLVAIELKNWISRTFHAPVQTSEVVDAPTIVILGSLIAGRSKLISDELRGACADTGVAEAATFVKDDSSIVKHQHKCCRYATELPKLPLIDLDNGLQQFLDNVRHFCTPEEYSLTVQAVDEFKADGSVGRKLYDQLVKRFNDSNVDYWLSGWFEENTWLSTRGPIAPYTNYLATHHRGPVQHSQAVVAAIIASMAFKFKQAVDAESDELDPHRYFGVPSCMDMWQWLFNAPREPHLGCDIMRKFVGDEYNYLVALRRGHVFKIILEEGGMAVSYESLKASFQAILDKDIEADSWVPILTADDRDSWAQVREAIKMESAENQKYLSVIEGAAFIVCLDDASPETPEETVEAFYLSDGFNRWFDCGLQFVVATNGVSGTCVNHSMIDGLAIHRVNDWITDALHAHSESKPFQNGINGVTDNLEEYSCITPPSIEQRIIAVRKEYRNNTSKVEYHDFQLTHIGKELLLANNSPVKGTFDLIIQLASRLYFGYNPAAWEAVSMAHFHRGRPELVQVVTGPVEEFCTAAMNDSIDVETRHRLLMEAVKDYSQNVRNAGYGNSYHRTIEVMNYLLDKDDPVPALFSNPAYLKTARGSLLSTGMTDGGSRSSTFVMRGDPDAVWLLYSVSDDGALFQLVGKKGSMRRFASCLSRAAEAVRSLLLMAKQS